MYQLTDDPYTVVRISDGLCIPLPPQESEGFRYAAWVAEGNTPAPATIVPTPTQFELDQNRYRRRAMVQAELTSYMAADNMSRVRSGTWTVAQLTSLLEDPAVEAAKNYMNTLSYELAAQSINAATTPLLTAEIKADWIAKLTAYFYLTP